LRILFPSILSDSAKDMDATDNIAAVRKIRLYASAFGKACCITPFNQLLK
jgi:hypothetical protein